LAGPLLHATLQLEAEDVILVVLPVNGGDEVH
jgi:hypothetical protein